MRNRPVALSFALLVCALSLVARGQATPATDDSFFTIVVVPDTQYYTETAWKNEQYFKGQTKWIVENAKAEHIAFVSHVGDIQQDGTYLRLEKQPDPEAAQDVANADPKNPPLNERQWKRADEAMRILDESDIPYCAVAGNHDFEHWGKIYKPVFYLKYFGPQRFAGKSWFGGSSPASSKQPAGVNTYQTFSAGGYKFLSIGLRFAPDSEDLAWAQKVIDANPGFPTMITTHAYTTNKGFDKDRRNIWEDLVRKNPQIFLTLNGHENGHNFVTEKNDGGSDVYEILVDYQDFEFPGYARGGGYLRLMRFYPRQDKVEVKTYSPITKKFMDDPKDSFTFECNFGERFASKTKSMAGAR